MRIDLHTHSAVSDGTDTPRDLALAAKASGLDAFALTDHDTTAGWDEARKAAMAAGVVFIPGIEISTRWEGRSVHMLAYGCDPSPSSPLERRLREVRDSRLTRARSMVERLSADFPVTWDEVCRSAREHGIDAQSVGRPHIADALVRAGVVPSRSAAFEDILSPRSSYYVRYDAIDSAEAVTLVHETGGVAVGAHLFAHARGGGAEADGIRALADAGLDGLEVHHREHSEANKRVLLDLAEDLGLAVTGGSDYHGLGKPNVLGENVTDLDQCEMLFAKCGLLAGLSQ